MIRCWSTLRERSCRRRAAALGTIAVCLLCACAEFAAALEPADAKNDKSQYASEPFDIGVAKLPDGYKGHDAEAIEQSISDILMAEYGKSFDPEEYSTRKDLERALKERERDFERLMRSLKTQNIVGNLKIGSRVAFCLPPKKGIENPRVYYGTDEYERQGGDKVKNASVAGPEYINARLLPNNSVELKVSRYWSEGNSFLLFTDLDSQGYSAISLGVNEILKSTDGLKRERKETALVFQGFQLGEKDYAGIWRLKNLNEEALKRVDYLAVCCIGKLMFPSPALLWRMKRSDESAKVDYTYRAVFLEAVQFWVYDYETGEVYAKFTVPEMCGGAAKSFVMTKSQAVAVKQSASKSASGSKPDDVAANFYADSDVSELLDENLEVERTWEKTLADSRDKLESWERSLATIVVPDDYPTLAEAIAATSAKDVISIRKGRVPFAPPVPPSRGVVETLLDKNLTILGESGVPADAIVEATQRDCLTIKGANFSCKGVTFLLKRDDSSADQKALVRVTDGAKAVFKYCDFWGAREAPTYGVAIDDSTATFWKCAFAEFSETALLLQSRARANVGYCELGPNNKTAIETRRESNAVVLRSRLFDNRRAFSAAEGGGGRIEESFFERNVSPWAVSAGSSRNVQKRDNVVKH